MAASGKYLDVIFRLGEASVADVLEQLPDPPAYDSVRRR